MKNVKNIALKMRNTHDLLDLINAIKQDELGEQYHPYTEKQLLWFGNPNHVFHRYREFEIPKKSGGKRKIAAPYSENYKHLLRYIGAILHAVYEPSAHAMGFVPGRSIVDNAKAHMGMRYIFNIDLKDFFPSFHFGRIYARLQVRPFNFTKEVAGMMAGICTMRIMAEDSTSDQPKYCYVLPQGSPASPIITNLMCDKLDFLLSSVAKRFGLRYTRYADDITFSSLHNVYQEDSKFRKELKRIIEALGFAINDKKTRLNIVGNRQEVTGLTVSDAKVNVSRQYIKDLRSILYIWEKYGYAAAESRLHAYNKKNASKSQKRKGTSLSCVVNGKLMFLKMVKGELDSTYIALQKRYDSLMNKCQRNQPQHTKYLYRETYTLAQFEKKKNTTINFLLVDANNSKYHAKFVLAAQMVYAKVKDGVDITTPKHQLCISYCENKDASKSIWYIHEPYKSQHFKDVVNIDKLNEELDALLGYG